MPIVVRELVIRARVEETNSASNNGTSGSNNVRIGMDADRIDGIIALCVEKVMETIERKKER